MLENLERKRYSDSILLQIDIVEGGTGSSIASTLAIAYFKKFVLIEKLSVLPQYRKNGVASELLSEIETWSTNKKIEYVIMRFAPCDFTDTGTLTKFLKNKGYKSLGLFHYKKVM